MERDVHLWMHAHAPRAQLGQKGRDSSLGQPSQQRKRGCARKRGRAGCRMLLGRRGRGVTERRIQGQGQGRGRGWEQQTNRPTVRHPTPWQAMASASVLLWLCADCQKHEVRADPFEIGCESTDTACHSAPMQKSDASAPTAPAQGCLQASRQKPKHEQLRDAALSSYREGLAILELACSCKRKHLHMYCQSGS